jgi:hypothetical protein
MLKNIVKLELKIGDKIYQFLCDNDSPLEYVKEALFQFQKYVGCIEDQIKAQQEQAKVETPAPEVKEE